MSLQYTLPKRRKVTKSGIERGPRKEWPAHRRFVRSFGCSVPGCDHIWSPIEFAHYRTAANSGTGTKPPDWFGLSLCAMHHREQHSLGQDWFEHKYSMNMAQMAAEFARKTTDMKMREAMKEHGI